MKIAFLTSSRADFGIYLPLLKAITKDVYFDARLIVFGTHLSALHGNTIKDIQKEGFTIDHSIETVMNTDLPVSIAESIGITIEKFSKIWQQEESNYEIVFCLGDRYEMFAAVSASVPFGITLAHIHGGETTLGAIDNKFRHCLTHFSSLHFVSTEEYAKKVEHLTGSSKNIYNTGALSLDNIPDISLYYKDEMWKHFDIDFSVPTLLVTYHPETAVEKGMQESGESLVESLKTFKDYQIVITMPNADTYASLIRTRLQNFAKEESRVKLVENFGTQGYFSAMYLSKLIIGNSSSGIIEAASFKKYVVNIGIRQEGRAISENIINVSNQTDAIIKGIEKGLSCGEYKGSNLYSNGGAVNKIIEVLKIWKK